MFDNFIQIRQLVPPLALFEKGAPFDHGQDVVKSHPLLQPIRLQEIKCTNKK